ncbi:hypothetical protein CVT25_011586 [Psilocybe cyanescens]|uniref:ER-derived vesicles protein ERV14 n=1 Tax=Psilocybe cyanescens TaxID=93625 RepID=A0A409XCK1_PSICY|nr:hypothetical protein CVT25_011586 [Psilocybe cyanescens]
MSGWLFLFAVLYAAALLFGMVFFIIMYSDLESDYINPIDFCNKLNQFVIPEYAAHAFLALLFLLTGQWTSFLWNVPLLAYNINKVVNKAHMYDATEIFRSLPQHQKEAYFKTGFYLLSFFFYLYKMIIIMFSDLECDYINPIDLCNKLNQFVLPENIAHAFLTLLFLLSGQWIAFVLNLPLVLFNANKIRNKAHMYDATEIFRSLSGHKQETFIKLGFYLLSFFYYLYRYVFF